MGYATNISVNIRGVDQTKQAFNTATNNAAKLKGSIQGIFMGQTGKVGSLFSGLSAAAAGATAAIGGFVIAGRKLISVAKEMSHLTDEAQRAGTTTPELVKLSHAMGQLGIKGGDIDNLATSMSRMVKTTGLQGADSFLGYLRGISQVEDAQARALLLTQAFGRAGENYQPLVAANGQLLDQLEDIIEKTASVSEQSAQAGDAMADAADSSANTWKQAGYEIVGTFAQIFTNTTDKAKESMGEVWKDVANAATGIFSLIAGAVGGVLKTVLNLLDDVLGVIKTVGIGLGALVAEVQGLFDKDFASGEGFKYAGEQISELWQGLGAEWEEMVTDMMNWSPTDLFAGTQVTESTSAAEQAKEEAERRARKQAEAAEKVRKKALEDIVKMFSEKWDNIKSSFLDVFDTAIPGPDEWKEKMDQARKVYNVPLAGVAYRGSHEAQVAEWRATNPNAQWSDKVQEQQLSTQRNLLTEAKGIGRAVLQTLQPLQALAGLQVY